MLSCVCIIMSKYKTHKVNEIFQQHMNGCLGASVRIYLWVHQGVGKCVRNFCENILI